MKKASGFYADSLEMLLDTMCNMLGAILFIMLVLAVMSRSSAKTAPDPATTTTNELSAVLQSNTVMEAEIQRVLLHLQEPPQQAPTNQMKLPEIGQTMRQPWNVIVRYGQLYPLHLLAPGTPSGRVNNSSGLAWRRGAIEPRPGQGQAPQGGVENMALAFQHGANTNFYFAFWVYEDSFAEFNQAKETAARLGFEYGWEPVAQDTPLQLNDRGQDLPTQNSPK
jgi:hypothetical protein